MKTQKKDRWNHVKSSRPNQWRFGLAVGVSLIFAAISPSAKAELPTHDVAAGTLQVLQASTVNSNTLTVTVLNSVNDFRSRGAGGNNGDIDVQIGDIATDDAPNGVLMSSVAEHMRNNDGIRAYTAVSMTANNANGYFIPVNSAGGFGGGANEEFNINVAGAWFPYSSWLGAVAVNSANGGPITTFVGSPSLGLGTHFIDNGNGTFVVDLTSLGIDSRTNGILLVSGAKNESANFGLTQANPTNGTWNLFIKDVGAANATAFEQDGVAFVFIPKTNTSVISGKFLGDGTISMFSGLTPQFTVTNIANGRYELKFPGRFTTNGVLIISPEGGGGTNLDNMVTYQANGTSDGYEIQTRDTPAPSQTTPPPLESPSPGEAVISFVYIPVPTPGITADPAGNLITTEAGGTADFTVRLDLPPAADVTVSVASSNPNEGQVSTASLSFTPLDWNIPQQVTITGQDDLLQDGAVAYDIVLTPSSADPIYNAVVPVNVGAINADNEAGTVVNPTSGLQTTEGGVTANFSVRLNKLPTSDVTINFSSSSTAEGTVSPPSLTFTPGDWDQEQVVTVTGVNDFVDDGDIAYTIISAPAVSGDPAYNGYNSSDVSVVNIDDDTADIIILPTAGLSVTEAGSTNNYTVVLQTQPAADVTVNVSSGDLTEGTVSPPTLTFTPLNWNIPQPVTLTGVDDLVQDGDIAYAISNTFSSSDPLYAVFAPVGVGAIARDSEAVLTLSTVDTFFAIGMPPVGVDGRASIFDPYSPNYNGGTLTVSLIANGTSDDRLEVRNTGNGPGQIGVSGNTVSYGGTPIATTSGGTGTTPLVISFNSSATPTAAEALLRSVTFRNVNSEPSLATRTVSVAFTDGDGGVSATVSKSIRVGLLRQSQFQEGADWGYGTYTGAVDIQIHQPLPDTPFPVGNVTNRMWINWPDDASANASQVLLQFNNIFGTGPGQVPTNAVIVGADLVFSCMDGGDGSPLYRLLQPWDPETSTWNSVFGGDGIQPNGSDAPFVADSQIGVEDGSGSTGTGLIQVSVRPDIIAWANGELNYGWGMPGFFQRADGTGVNPCEAPNIDDRPRLRVLWLPAGTAEASFRQGVNSYTGAFDTRIRQNAPDANYATVDTVFVDAIVSGSTNNPEEILIRFDDIIGSTPGQVPPNAKVHAAMLDLASLGNNAMGDGGQFYALLQPWVDATTTWNTWVDGVDTNGIEAAANPTGAAGFAERAPNVQGGYNSFELTPDVAAWASGAQNNGWVILPWDGGGDGWGIGMAESALETTRPQLRVYFTPSTDSRISSISRTPTSVTIQINGVPGTLYTVLRSGDVAGPYGPIGTATAEQDGTASFTDNSPLAGTGFYRLSAP